ncbi:MAG: glycosyltransferase [Actinomycetota bacterium]|nr:glycosyltransferase [Actinomycetota bacterium]
MVVNYLGGDLTVRCLRSVRGTEWPADRLQVVVVDNSPSDGVAVQVRQLMPDVTVLDAGTNRGFAGGCNLALADLDDVDYVALLNNDTTVDPGWLRPLVARLEADPGIGAANSKILFASPFVDVGISATTGVRGRGDRRPLGVRLSGIELDGKDAFADTLLAEGFWGLEPDLDGGGPSQWTSGRALLRVPVAEGAPLPVCRLRLASDGDRAVVLTSGCHRVEHRVTPEPAWYEVPLGGEPFRVINNVGSVLLEGGYGADRGYMEPDRGQFDTSDEIFAWCGAAVLLSRPYLESVGPFDDRFFLYYEDFDLSWRGRAKGWRYVCVPESVVHHLHSASSVVGSRLFSHFTERNRLLTLTRNAPLALACRQAGRHLLVTGSYARRDILSPLAHTRRPSGEVVYRRLRAFAAYLRLLPAGLAARRHIRANRSVDDRELLEWMVRD